MGATVEGSGTVTFYWKVSSESGDYLKFYIDGQYQTGISGSADWEKKSYSLSAGSRTLKWVYSKDGSGYGGEDCGWVDGLTVGTTSYVGQADQMSEALDSNLKFTESGTGSWYAVSGITHEYYYEADSAESEAADDEEACLQTIVDSDSSETIKFYWKVSSVQGYDYLQFYIDGTLKDQISGEVDWQQKSYSVTSGIHILKWRYARQSTTPSGDNCGWVDFVQWTGPSPAQDPENWQQIAYKQDVAGRRVEKKVDGYSTRYVYDGDHIIAEYDGNNNLLRKYIYGPGVDQPISMIEVAQSNTTYYYHFDALGSVVALSDAAGDTVQTYQYSVYGEAAVEDANHTNPYMFAGVRYDIEIGLYYNRARYYNPFTGRFLQADPVGYEAGMNMYAYCGNDPVGSTDPSGLRTSYGFLDLTHEKIERDAEGHPRLTFARFEDGQVVETWGFDDMEDWYARIPAILGDERGWKMEKQVGYNLAFHHFEAQGNYTNEWLFWRLQGLYYLNGGGPIAWLEQAMADQSNNRTVTIRLNIAGTHGSMGRSWYDPPANNNINIHWDPFYTGGGAFPPLASLAHELQHAWDYVHDGQLPAPYPATDARGRAGWRKPAEESAITHENGVRDAFRRKVPNWQDIQPRRVVVVYPRPY